MSEKELLQRFRALSVSEQRKFLRDARASRRLGGSAQRSTRRVQWPDVETRAMRNSGNRVVLNLVLMERTESAF